MLRALLALMHLETATKGFCSTTETESMANTHSPTGPFPFPPPPLLKTPSPSSRHVVRLLSRARVCVVIYCTVQLNGSEW